MSTHKKQDRKAKQLADAAQRANDETRDAIVELTRALDGGPKWEKRIPKLFERATRARDRFLDAVRACEEHHAATCEECALHRVADRLMLEIVQEHVTHGAVPPEERN
jgi:hypothetical protein